MIFLFKVYRASGRPDRVVGTFSSKEEAYVHLDEITCGNEILQQSYKIVEGVSYEDVTYTSEDGFIHFK